MLEYVFNIYAHKKSKESNKYMLETDFLTLLSDLNIYDQKFMPRHARICFHLSLFIRVDELNGDLHQRMSFSEFVFAFSQVCEYMDEPNPDEALLRQTFTSGRPLSDKLEDGLMLLRPIARRRRR